jgi:uncharacterized protein YutE (UPF0331/DUF86 family)
MTNISVVENKVSSIKRYLGILSSYQGVSVEQLEADATLRGAVERYLYLLAQATIDLAEALIAFRGLRKPGTMGESFTVLWEAGLLTQDLAVRLTRMAGFRNILAHDYERLNYEIVVAVLRNHLVDVEEFISSV